MAIAIASASSAGFTPGSSGAEAPVALQSQLSKCQRQLGDWEACESSKTPQGQRIIQNLRAQIGSIEAKIANSGQAPTRPARPNLASQEPQTPSVYFTGRARLNTTGVLLDTFA